MALSNPLNSRRSRLKMLHQRLADIELKHSLAQPIPTIRVRTCRHPECGKTVPRNLPADVLIIRLGCKHAIPGRTTNQHPSSPDEEGKQSSI